MAQVYVYVYQAALLCKDCAKAVMSDTRCLSGLTEDSDAWPQGPYGDGGGEADTPQHCDHCGVFLENPLTGDGYEYVAEAINSHIWYDRGSVPVLKQWGEFYRYDDSFIDNAMLEWQVLRPQDWQE